MTAFTKDFLNTVLADASEAAEKAANEWLANAKPRYVVFNTDLAGNRISNVQDYMLDLCGYAYLVVKDKRSAFYKALKKFDIIHDRYTPTLPINYELRFRQEMGLHEAAIEAARQVLVTYDLAKFIRTWSYID